MKNVRNPGKFLVSMFTESMKYHSAITSTKKTRLLRTHSSSMKVIKSGSEGSIIFLPAAAEKCAQVLVKNC